MPLPPLKNMLEHYDDVEEPSSKPSIDFASLLTEGSEEYIEKQACLKNRFKNIIKIADAAHNKFPWLNFSVIGVSPNQTVLITNKKSSFTVVSLWISEYNYMISEDGEDVEFEEFSTLEGFAKRVGYILESSKEK